MKIKESKNLEFIAKRLNKTEEEISDMIISFGLKHKVFENEPEYWGVSIENHLFEMDFPIENAIGCKHMLCLNDFPDQYLLRNFLALITIGDGDCPVCGGELELKGGEYKQVGGFDNDSEPEFEPLWTEKKCLNCGTTISDEPNNEKEYGIEN